MGIRNFKKRSFLFFIIFIILFIGDCGILGRLSNSKNEKVDIPETSGSDLPDKVFLFQAPQDTLLLEDITLEQYYTYYIWVELVTPNNCSIKITIWDSLGNQFNIFESILFINPEGGNYYEIPFGTALTGNYDIKFYTISSGNVNIYIKIEKGAKCLFDKIPLEEFEYIEYYKITPFSNEESISFNITFKMDYMYKFYVGRVSPISVIEDNEVRIDLSIEDPEGINYIIYHNTTLAGIDDIDRFKFGTAVEGSYKIDINVYCNVENVNVGYSIVRLYQISSGTDINQTEIPSNSTRLNQYFTMPTEWTIGILGFAGTISAVIGVIIYKQKRKNVLSSDF